MFNKNYKHSISENVLKEIKIKNIKPIPKLYFTIKTIAKYIILFLLIFISSILFAGIISFAINYWDTPIKLLNELYIIQIVVLTPFILACLFLINLFLFLIMFKKTEWGYKYQAKNIIVFNLFFIIIIWLFLVYSWNYKKIEKQIFTKLWMQNIVDEVNRKEIKMKIWYRPDDWYLIWKIQYLDKNAKVIVIKDHKGIFWQIKINQNTKFQENIFEAQGNIIQIIWKRVRYHPYMFDAKNIIPYIVKW